jgi:anti-sigma factor RsiW
MRPGAALSCQELVELVTDYVEGSLSRRQRRRFEAHIGGCDGCTTYVEEMRETIRLTGRLDPEALAPATREELLTAFRTWKTA